MLAGFEGLTGLAILDELNRLCAEAGPVAAEPLVIVGPHPVPRHWRPRLCRGGCFDPDCLFG